MNHTVSAVALTDHEVAKRFVALVLKVVEDRLPSREANVAAGLQFEPRISKKQDRPARNRKKVLLFMAVIVCWARIRSWRQL